MRIDPETSPVVRSGEVDDENDEQNDHENADKP